MRFLTLAMVFACIAAPGAVFAQTSSGASLSGKMAPFAYVFGAPWNCTANVPAMGGQPAHTEKSTVTFDVVPNNVMHVHIASDTYVGDQYFGYSTRGNSYWSTTADSNGVAAAEVSADGKVYKGSMNMGPMNGSVQDTYNKADNNHVTITSAVSIAGQSATTTVACAR